jgi:hypothetical protein
MEKIKFSAILILGIQPEKVFEDLFENGTTLAFFDRLNDLDCFDSGAGSKGRSLMAGSGERILMTTVPMK